MLNDKRNCVIHEIRLIKPLVLRRFRCRCGLCKISAVVVYKKSRCRLISVLFASIFVI